MPNHWEYDYEAALPDPFPVGTTFSSPSFSPDLWRVTETYALKEGFPVKRMRVINVRTNQRLEHVFRERHWKPTTTSDDPAWK